MWYSKSGELTLKTSGFREIDFTKIECKNCGYFVNYYGYLNKGKVMKSFPDPNISDYQKAVDCPVCKGTGYIDETGEQLELE